jgi:hypothetical protein
MQRLITLVADQDGKARFVRSGNSCEHVIRPYRETQTPIDLTWAIVDVSANGYSPIEKQGLANTKHEQKGHVGGCQRVEFSLPLRKQAN